MSLEDDLEILRGLGINLEPDTGRGPYHRRIVLLSPIPDHPGRHYCVLECGHTVMTIGDLRHANGWVSCDRCKAKA